MSSSIVKLIGAYRARWSTNQWLSQKCIQDRHITIRENFISKFL